MGQRQDTGRVRQLEINWNTRLHSIQDLQDGGICFATWWAPNGPADAFVFHVFLHVSLIFYFICCPLFLLSSFVLLCCCCSFPLLFRKPLPFFFERFRHM